MDAARSTTADQTGTARLQDDDPRGTIATFAAGCFWGVEKRFRAIDGVIDAEVGYSGGTVPEPDYRLVCGGTTEHAESVRVLFDPNVIGYADLVRRFFELHNPTTPNRQGPDIGSQYRSVIFAHDPTQEAVARQVIEELNAQRFGGGIVTQVVPAAPFWRAEEYHQQYHAKQLR